ncbi:hypothetical protein DFH09DRAFT_1401942 [Mycena vulgaris]|nr:hypothetical protein DFH09DRAFT_1401942 [Mycena vulgaris]
MFAAVILIASLLLAAAANPIGSAKELAVRITLKPNNITGLETAIYTLSDPANPSYGQHLTLDELTAFAMTRSLNLFGGINSGKHKVMFIFAYSRCRKTVWIDMYRQNTTGGMGFDPAEPYDLQMAGRQGHRLTTAGKRVNSASFQPIMHITSSILSLILVMVTVVQAAPIPSNNLTKRTCEPCPPGKLCTQARDCVEIS